jgi:hypothetical protein
MKMAVFWVVAPCSLVEVYRRFRGPCCLHYQGDRENLKSYQINWYWIQLTSNKLESNHGYYKIWLTETIFVRNLSKSLQPTLAADAHLAEGQFLIEELKLNIESLWDTKYGL